MSNELLRRLFENRKVYRTGELTRAGVQTRTLLRAIEQGALARPVLSQALGPVPGVIVAADAVDHPDLAVSIAALLTGGVVSGQYAAMTHGLTTSIPDLPEMTLLKGTSAPPAQARLSVRWTRIPSHMEIGVEDGGAGLGVPVRMTGKARTIVDLLRFPSRQDDYRHGQYALVTFLDQGGHVAEIEEIAGHFGKAPAAKIAAHCDTAAESHQRSFGA